MVEVVGYCRISKDVSDTQLGVERQRKDIRELCKRKGWKLAGEYVDNDISAARRGGVVKERPQYRAMLAAIVAGDIDGVVVWDQDRLCRDPMELEEFLITCEGAGMTRLVTVGGEEPIDIESGEGILMLRIKAAVAAEEVRKMRKRVLRKHLELAENGKIGGGGHRPFGYEPDRLTIRESEAVLIREAVDQLLSPDPALRTTIGRIVREWTQAGVATVTGTHWSSPTVKRLLMSARISGRRSHRGKIVSTAVWPAIITPEQSDAVRLLLSQPERNLRALSQNARSYLLAGMLRCGNCNAKLQARPMVTRNRYGTRYYIARYWCAKERGGCNRVGISAPNVEQYVVSLVLASFDRQKLRTGPKRKHKSERPQLVHELADLRKRMDEAAHDYYVAESLDRRAFDAVRTELERRIADVEARVNKLDVVEMTAADPRQLLDMAREWDDIDFQRRRYIIGALIDHVVVAPVEKRGGNRFNPDRLTVAWR